MRKRLNDLTQNYLKSILNYNPETGIFTWLKTRPGISPDARAGNVNSCRGYVLIGINRRYYAAHRLAWLYMTGEWPGDILDHIDNDKANNRWVNLREATSQQNNWNKKASSRNKSGFKGVTSRNGKFIVYICLGSYDTAEEASKIYKEAALKLQGEFAHKSIKE